MTVEKTPLQDCLLIKPRIFQDERGCFFESFHQDNFIRETGINTVFVQDNQSVSQQGALRGLHLQLGEKAQAKLVRVIHGKVLDVVVDLREKSPSFGKTYSVLIDGEKNHQLYVPRGFAHGFITLSETAIFAYKCDNYYDKSSEAGILYNDATLAIDWGFPLEKIIVSPKDLQLPSLADFLGQHGAQ